MLRELIAAALILAILGIVLSLGVSGFLHIALVTAAALLTFLLARGSAESAEKGPHG